MAKSKRDIYLESSLFLIILIPILLNILVISSNPTPLLALNKNNLGQELFEVNCAGCHVNGGNIIRRNKTLKLKALKKNEIDTPEKIALIARKGIGIMSGYEDNLKEGEDIILANWVWENAQKAWIHG